MGSHPRLAVASRVPPVLSKGRSRGLSLSRVLCRISDGLGFKGVLVTSWTNSRLLRSSFLGEGKEGGESEVKTQLAFKHIRVVSGKLAGGVVPVDVRALREGRSGAPASWPRRLTHLQDGRPRRGKPGPQGESFRVRGERPS